MLLQITHKKERKKERMEEGSGSGGGSRWNPTKDQIKTLEGLYKQGLRTPTAQQIQHITARLREHGHIEGKNVFYWFQNHKARQRQKQKLKLITAATTNHHLYYNYHHHRVIHPTPAFHNGFYQQYPRVQLPTAGNHYQQQQTLDLFPIHPTGVLRAENGINGTENEAGIQSVQFNTSTSSEYENDCSGFGYEKAGQDHCLFDFFCKK